MTTNTAPPASTPGPHAPRGITVNSSVLEKTLSTTPTPVQVSPASGNYHKADLTVVLTRRSSSPIECDRITLDVPVGSNAAALAAETAGMTATTDPADWTTAITTSGQVTFTPPGGLTQISKDRGLALTLHGIPVNRTVGRAQLTMTAHWRVPGEVDQTGEPVWNDDTAQLPLPKFPAAFHLSELRADPTHIPQGGSVTLTWQAAAADLRLRYDKADISVTGDSYTVHNINRETIFQLTGTNTSGSEQLELVRTALVSVALPDVTTRSATAKFGVITDRLVGEQPHTAPAFTPAGARHRPELSMRTFDPRQRRWTEPVRLPFPSAATPPAITTHDGKLHLLFRPHDSENLTWAQYDGTRWRTMANSPGPSIATPFPSAALTSAGTTLISAYRTPAGEHLTRTSTDGASWGPPSVMPDPGLEGVSICWDGTTLLAATQALAKPLIGGHNRRRVLIHRRNPETSEWRNVHTNYFIHAAGTPELVLHGQTYTYYTRLHSSSVYTWWRHGDAWPVPGEGRHVGLQAAGDVRLAVAGPMLYALFPDSEGTLHLHSTGGPDGPSTNRVDDYPAPETPALAWYGNHLIAIGRGGVCPS